MVSFSALQPSRPYEPFLLVAEIDGTLIGDEEGEIRLKTFVKKFPGSLHLAVVTGHGVPKVGDLLKDGRLPPPDYVCGAVGTELFASNDPKNLIGQRFASRVPPGWDLETIYALGVGEGIVRQDFPEGQPLFQAGFYWDGRPETLAAFQSRFAGREGLYILPSSGKFIDVLPASLGKGNFVWFLLRELGMDPARVVVAGDTGSDRQMFETEFQGILPANALEELKAVARQPWHYLSPYPAGRGVLDGLVHFGLVEGEVPA